MVNSLDEYAALLNYYNDLFPTNVPESVSKQNPNLVTPLVADTYYSTTEKTLWDDALGLSWIKGFVTKAYSTSTNLIIGTPTTDSQLYGFHPGNTWIHSPYKSSAVVNTDRKTGYANIVGDLTLSIIFEGVGNITTKQVSYYMTF